MSTFINDGFSDFRATIPALSPCPEVAMQYRPALIEEASIYRKKVRYSAVEAATATLSLLLEHLHGWDITSKAGRPEPITKENLRRLPPRLVEKMAQTVVSGYTIEEQRDDERNLSHGVAVFILHPDVFNVTCKFCEAH